MSDDSQQLEEQIEGLPRMVSWRSTMSASDAARELGVTRNAILKTVRRGHLNFADGRPAWHQRRPGGVVYIHLPTLISLRNRKKRK